MGQALESFEVGTLDMGGISDADLQTKRYLRKPGTYNFVIDEYKLTTSERNKDAAGKQWGTIQLNVRDLENDYSMTGFISVPIESVVYTAKSGNTSKVKTQIFTSFINSLTGSRPALADLRGVVIDLPNLLKGGTFRAKIGYASDFVAYVGKGEEDQAQFTIELRSGSRMLDSDGEAVLFNSREEAVEYYRAVKGFSPATGLSMLSFLKKEELNDEATA